MLDENNGRYLTWGYDNTTGLATSGSEAGGADAATLTYNSDGSTTVTDALGAVRVFTFGRYGDRSLVIGISGSRCSTCSELKTTTYDAYGFLSSRTDYNNNVTQYTYDDNRGLELSRTEAQSTQRARTITSSWNSTYREPMSISVYAGGTATGTALRTTSFTYDGSGNDHTKTVTDPATSASRTWTYTSDGYGRMLTAQAPRTDLNSTTTYTYYTCTTGYQCGELHTVTDAVGNLTTYNTYNAYGQPLTITDPNGVVTTLTYDNRLRLKSRQIGTETTSFSYYATGLLQTVTSPDGSTLTYTYDGAHRLTQVADGLGNKVIYTLDAMGNRTAENSYDPTSVLHRTHTRVINTLNETYQEINAAGTAAVTTTFGYDSNGNQTSIAAPLARNTTNGYDELNRLNQITDPNSGISKFTYDANDNLTSVLDPRTLATGYTYNGLGDFTQLTSPDTAGTSYTYDSGGNLATSTDARGAIATYTYDALNRVKTVAYKLGSTTDLTETYTYDTGTNGKGHLTGASDANHSMSWGYDALGRVVSKGQKIGSVTKTVGYAYTNGDLTTLTTPSGQTVAYGYNTNHQVTSISIGGVALLSGVTYEPLGPANGWTWANNTTEIRSYNTDANPNLVSAIESHTYGYDDALRVTSNANGSNSALSWTYGYDLLDRITSASETGLTQDWTYDANGNRLTETGTVAGTYNVSTTSNRLNSITGSPARTYTYDNAGSTLTYANSSRTTTTGA